jgi:hypothetical protein
MTATGYLRQFAGRAYSRGRQDVATLSFIAAHPRELARVRRWLRERNATTMTLRSPWWAYDAISWVAEGLPPQPRVFEYGGGSTLWLEDRGATVTVAEHDEQWHRQLAGRLQRARPCCSGPHDGRHHHFGRSGRVRGTSAHDHQPGNGKRAHAQAYWRTDIAMKMAAPATPPPLTYSRR